jgi:hypothetical protein
VTFWYKRDFEKNCRRYPSETQRLVAQAVIEIKIWYQTRQAPVGLRIKKLYEGPGGKVFEARVSSDLRLLWVEKEDVVWFSLVGFHDAIRRYIRTFR